MRQSRKLVYLHGYRGFKSLSLRQHLMNLIHPADLKNRQVLILGLGSFGGGAGCARALHELGAKVTVSDLRPASKLETSVNSLAGYAIDFVFEEHPESLFEQADVVVVNPAVPNEAPNWD